ECSQAAALLGEGRRGMDHRLFIACLVVAEAVAGLLEGLAQASHVAMAEDAEHAGKEPVLDAVALDRLGGEETDHGLRGGQPNGLGHRTSVTRQRINDWACPPTARGLRRASPPGRWCR